MEPSNTKEGKQQQQLLQQQKKKKWFLLLVLSLLFSTLLILISITTTSSSVPSQYFYISRAKKRHQNQIIPHFVESKLHISPTLRDPVPRLAYLISGSVGDGDSIRRVLKALYHPRNQYVVHLDLEASAEERLELSRWVSSEPMFVKVRNVRMVVRANLVTYRGPTMVTNTLHAAAILLREGGEWDWFINLSASDYPLVTQDDLLHTLATVPRNLNFIEHTSDIGWKEHQRAKPVIIDPGLYSLHKSDVFWISEKRSVPSAYKLFTGSAWMMLTRPFIEYCLWGWDNLPRIVLMYYANFLSSPEGYFHTVLCNAEEFRNTTVNHDLHFISWDNPPKQHPHFLTANDYQRMIDSNAPFARKFGRNEPVLDKIDSEILGRDADGFVPGGWLSGEGSLNVTGPNYIIRNTTVLRPGPGAERLEHLIKGLVSAEDFHAKHCI
ncbi:xylosyltransferase 1-like [Tripterygium wilfordii]|uniref:Xylosyltransferase 1-like n=1 Tax=Tripterygium wilfordii TaxID=458696 RepID=A0A7J7DTE0_TRIWF|nr:beta-glucuronosyltransferase GlcAT14B-like [Tripterygium wilfordii]KAF5749638.1 xylosyltransferase 1-like [Tripterygium wilfordii]